MENTLQAAKVHAMRQNKKDPKRTHLEMKAHNHLEAVQTHLPQSREVEPPRQTLLWTSSLQPVSNQWSAW